MTTSPKISIIIPVYNAEKYLRQCLDSVLAQTYTDFEVLLIDDGSTDASGKICDEYAAKDTRFTVFHKENGGVSAARNLGIENAKGEWITFVDSDDYIDEGFLKIFIDRQLQGDFLLMGVIQIIENEKIVLFQFNSNYSMSQFEFLNKFTLYQYFAGPWAKLFRADIIKNNHLKFNEGLSWGEDALFNLQYIKFCNTISIYNEQFYNYRVVNTGLNSGKVGFSKRLFLINEVVSEIKSINIKNNLSVALFPHIKLLLSLAINDIYVTNNSLRMQFNDLNKLDNLYHNELLHLYMDSKGKGILVYQFLKWRFLNILNLFFRLIIK